MNTKIIREEFTAWMRGELPANTIIGDPDWWARKILTAIATLDAKAEQEAGKDVEGPDSNCRDEDGCPTENAVLKRYWGDRERADAHPPAKVPDIKELFSGFQGCTNHDCIVTGGPSGIGTNGTCQCLVNLSRANLIILESRLKKAIWDSRNKGPS